jgi:hypothetical protein
MILTLKKHGDVWRAYVWVKFTKATFTAPTRMEAFKLASEYGFEVLK